MKNGCVLGSSAIYCDVHVAAMATVRAGMGPLLVNLSGAQWSCTWATRLSTLSQRVDAGIGPQDRGR